MSWRPVTDLLDRPEWYSAMYSLVAHRLHDEVANQHPHEQARREGILLALGCAAEIRRRTRSPLRRLFTGYPWPFELADLDRELFLSRYEERPPPPVPPLVIARVPWRYRIRHRQRPEREFTRFLERTVEPSALILLAGIPPVAPARDVRPWSRDELIDNLVAAARGRAPLDPHRLIATARRREGLDGRAHYNLACYYAQAFDFERAREHLRAAVLAASGSLRHARVRAAWEDPTLAPALEDWPEAEEVLRVDETAGRPAELPELERIAAIGGYAKKLAAHDITTAETLAKRLESPAARLELARVLDVDPQLLDRWHGLLRLLAIDGIGPAQLNLLEAAGVTTPEELLKEPAEDLHRRLVEANTARRLVRAVPSEVTLIAWRDELSRGGRI